MLLNHWHHHSHFYIALILALAAYVVANWIHAPVPVSIAGDVFFTIYLVASLFGTMRISRTELDKRADVQDEGILVILLITASAIAFVCGGVFVALNRETLPNAAALIITLIGAPLGWFMLHTILAFHYANTFYAGPENAEERALEFPGTADPEVLDFLYFSFVVGMTAQVSDVAVRTTRMRRVTLIHSIGSFFFNTVLIAIAVNAVVARAL